jgi:para-aminobenzoate synthetase component 1
MLNSIDAIRSINSLVKSKIPFLFIADFEKENNIVLPLNELNQHNIFFSIPGLSNCPQPKATLSYFKKSPITLEHYAELFSKSMAEIKKGNTFLMNLTVSTPIESNLNLLEFFLLANARYKLYYDDQFAVFSPESFVSIEDGVIKTFPMKGTIKADIPGALENILNNPKEAAEHATIVDLLRNDLSIMAHNVQVKRFRYADLINTNFGPIYQISSEIQGTLPADYEDNLGEIIFSLLPAGSVTGAPKTKTISIIKEIELEPRQFYTGIFGVWDTKRLVSAVMIRFIRNQNKNLFYHSGGGITFQSNCEQEYQELIDKIYVPVC